MSSVSGSGAGDGPDLEIAAGLFVLPTGSTGDEHERHGAPSALSELRKLIQDCDNSTRAPKWWSKMSPRFTACLERLELEQTGDPVRRAPRTAPDSDDEDHPLAPALADLKAQQAQVIRTLSQLAPAAHATRDRRTPPASGPHRRTPAFCITLSLADVPRKSPLLSFSAADVKAAIDSALGKSKIPALFGTSAHSVRHDRSKLFVHALSAEHKATLLKFPEEWLVALGSGVKIATRRISLRVDLVSTKFNASMSTAADALYLSNPCVIPSRDHLQAVRWLHGTTVNKAPRSSLVLTVTDLDTARSIVHMGICVLGEYCSVSALPPVPAQCFRCQGFGHQSPQCLKQTPPRPLACGRCASLHHPTRDCTCPARPACVTMRTCTHIQLRCINCNGEHKSFDDACPVKAAAIEQALQSPSYIALCHELLRKPL